MSTNSWASGISGDWNTGSLWAAGIVPDDIATDVAIAQPGTYTVTIAPGESETADSVTMGDPSATLSVSGVLTLTGTAPSTVFLGAGTIVTTPLGTIQGQGALAQSSFVNTGTLIANAGANDQLVLYAALTNTGTLLADDGDLLVANGFSNLSGSTLTGGTYISVGFIPLGETSTPYNQLAFGFNFNADLAVDDATIILDGQASYIAGFTGFNTGTAAEVPLEDQLQTIASGGTLELLDDRGFAATNTMLDAGMLVLGGGTLSTPGLTIASSGTLSGYGSVAGSLTNQGAVIASGGTLGSLILQGPVTGAGTITVLDGSTLLIPGGSADALTVGGLIYDTGTLDIAGPATGTGTIFVENGGALELGGSATPSLSFAGSNVTVTLDQPAGYQGTLVGFGQGDTLILDGIQGTSATVINDNTLVVMAGGTTLDTVTLAGNYTGATFTASTVGGDTIVTNLAGAPARDDMPIDLVSVTNNIGLSGSLVAAIENEVTYAAENWGQYITGDTPLRVSLTFVDSGDFGSEIALGSPGGFISNGQTIDGHTVYIPDSLYALETGDYVTGFSTDIAITLVASAANLQNLYINPDPADGTTVPLGDIDLLSVLTHEFGHGLGFIGLANRAAPASGSSPIQSGAEEAIYDSFIQDETINGTVVATFDGPNAEAAYGAAINAGSAVPVPLYLQGGSLDVENFYHVNGDLSGPLATDLMSPFLSPGTYIPISNIDLGILKDIGGPVTAEVACYARGTRIATARGSVAVEDLTLEDRAITARGVPMPIIWIGRRRVECRRHPRPERVQPIRIAAGAFAPGVPSRDLYLSPNHAIYFHEVLIPAYCLRNDTTVRQLDWDSIEYFHVELPVHDILLAEGLPAESYLECGDRHAFANAGGVTMLFPDFAGDHWEKSGYAPLVLRGPAVDRARSYLTARATDLSPEFRVPFNRVSL
jgi:hypothetical protein